MATQTVKRTNASRNNSNNESRSKIVVSESSQPVVRYFAERKISLINPQVARQLKHIDFFGMNYSTLMGAFIKASKGASVKLLDEYVDQLVSHTQHLVSQELKKYAAVKAEFEKKGYVFSSQATPQKVTVRIYRSCLNDITDLLLEIDELVSLLNHLEKTPYMKTTDLYVNVTDFVDIPNRLSRKVFGLTKLLNDTFNFNARVKQPIVDKVDFEKINSLLKTYQTEQINVLAPTKRILKKTQQKKSSHTTPVSATTLDTPSPVIKEQDKRTEIQTGKVTPKIIKPKNKITSASESKGVETEKPLSTSPVVKENTVARLNW